MDSQDLKQRTTTPAAITSDESDDSKKDNKCDNRRISMAKRGLRSLTIGVSIPVSLTLLAIYLGSGKGYRTETVPFWFPPLAVLHSASVASSFFMGVSAWLVWAEGGFHRRSDVVYLYWAQLGLSLLWDLLVFWAGLSWPGMVLVMAMFGSQVACYKAFKEVNPLSSQVLKPCLAWTAFLTILNLRLVFL
ncbi:translocator protein homolog [Humulus lupulus]|uniref:translocator protein homolog n=1 Tax=Humulus lupulus TaxID=3486 RepID=UPI002B413B8B|nr:translocator protein homolog [Humulus lupulus]